MEEQYSPISRVGLGRCAHNEIDTRIGIDPLCLQDVPMARRGVRIGDLLPVLCTHCGRDFCARSSSMHVAPYRRLYSATRISIPSFGRIRYAPAAVTTVDSGLCRRETLALRFPPY